MLISQNGDRLYFDILGPEGAPVVCLAHPLAADSGVWAPQIGALLAAGYRVLRIDMRGHGGSDATSEDASMEELVGDVVYVLNTLEIDRVFFVGISIGGMIGEGLAILHPDRVIAMMLGNSRAAAPEDAEIRWGPRIAEVKAKGNLSPLADATMERWLSSDCRATQPSLAQQIRDTVANTSVEGYVACARAIMTFDWTSRLSMIQAPTLVVCGADDKGSDLGENQMIAETVQLGTFRAIENARHLPNVENPELFNALLIDWFSRYAPKKNRD